MVKRKKLCSISWDTPKWYMNYNQMHYSVETVEMLFFSYSFLNHNNGIEKVEPDLYTMAMLNDIRSNLDYPDS